MRSRAFHGVPWRVLMMTCWILSVPIIGRAQSYTSGPGLALAITDDAYDGTLASMESDTIPVFHDGTEWVVGVTVEVAMDHTRVGDLVFKLESPGGTVVTLAHRPGLDGVLDDGDGCCGSSADLEAVFPILFSDTAPSGVSAEDMGNGVAGTIGDPANGSPDNYTPDADDLSVDVGGPLADSLHRFVGEQAPGSWTLYVGDAADGDVGVLDGWTLHLVTDTPACPGDSLYSQTPNQPLSGIQSDAAAAYTLYDNFPVPAGELAEPVCEVRWWGMYRDQTGSPCNETLNAFQLTFYDDVAGLPGDEVCSYAVDAARIVTGLRLNGEFPIYEFRAELPSCCPLSSGWVSIVAEAGEAACRFHWMASADGDVSSIRQDGASFISVFGDRALCLAAMPDGDGDLVPDGRDACPGTASGDPVDAEGCSTADDDGDGVLNDEDGCPDTPGCADVDSNGCPLDADGDGVADGCDDCSGTAAGDPVDADGCSTADDDSDGVLNDQDACPDTPACATNVGADGCAADTDGDGNFDGCEPPAQQTGCCGAGGPVAPLGLAVGMMLLIQLRGGARTRTRKA